MSCACEHKRMAGEYDRMWRLAKALAKLQKLTVALFKNPDGTYGFSVVSDDITDKEIVEYISPY